MAEKCETDACEKFPPTESESWAAKSVTILPGARLSLTLVSEDKDLSDGEYPCVVAESSWVGAWALLQPSLDAAIDSDTVPTLLIPALTIATMGLVRAFLALALHARAAAAARALAQAGLFGFRASIGALAVALLYRHMGLHDLAKNMRIAVTALTSPGAIIVWLNLARLAVGMRK